jgi:hypothetical protein
VDRAHLGGALAVGVIANHWVRPFAKTEVYGIKLRRLSADDDIALPLQTALVCYGRAVVNVEWPRLADGIQLHPLPTQWAGEIDMVVAQMAASGDTSQPYATLLGADRHRADARGQRIIEAEPAVPFSVRLLMVLGGARSLASFAAVSLPEISRGVRIGALVVMAFVFLAMHWTIYEIDHKFDGVIQVEPVEMILLSTAMADQFAERHPDVVLPCDERGLPL